MRPPETARAVAGEMLRVIGALGANSMVAPFVDAYAARFDRPGLKASARYHELLATIGRESLLAMAAKMHRELPRLLGRGRPAMLRGAAAEATDAFRQGFLEYVAEILEWSPAERDEFRRDLGLYAELAARDRRPRRTGSRQPAARGPFADRCALLLDPAMLPEARQAASKYLVELEARTEQILRHAFRWR